MANNPQPKHLSPRDIVFAAAIVAFLAWAFATYLVTWRLS